MPTLFRNVRSQGQSRKHVLALSCSGFDPEGTSAFWYFRHALPQRCAWAFARKVGCYSFRGTGSDGGKAWVERKARVCGGSSKARARLAEVFAVGPLAQV
jgi:hypothetical protein